MLGDVLSTSNVLTCLTLTNIILKLLLVFANQVLSSL